MRLKEKIKRFINTLLVPEAIKLSRVDLLVLRTPKEVSVIYCNYRYGNLQYQIIIIIFFFS